MVLTTTIIRSPSPEKEKNGDWREAKAEQTQTDALLCPVPGPEILATREGKDHHLHPPQLPSQVPT